MHTLSVQRFVPFKSRRRYNVKGPTRTEGHRLTSPRHGRVHAMDHTSPYCPRIVHKPQFTYLLTPPRSPRDCSLTGPERCPVRPTYCWRLVCRLRCRRSCKDDLFQSTEFLLCLLPEKPFSVHVSSLLAVKIREHQSVERGIDGTSVYWERRSLR